MKQLEIKSPCQKNWNEFTPQPEGGFCGSCQKTVIDFTNKSNREIQAILLAKSEQNLCGRIGIHQLDNFNSPPGLWQDYQSPRTIQSRFLWALILSFGLTLFTAHEAQAQAILGKVSYIEKQDTMQTIFTIPQKNNAILDTTLREEIIMGEIEESIITPDSTKEDSIPNDQSKNCNKALQHPKLNHPTVMGMMSIPESRVGEKPKPISP